jgi:propanol-preferring alcohol dehydrogenase
MQAAILKELGKPLEIHDLDEPALLPGCVKIKVLSAHLLSYHKEVLSGDPEKRPPPVPYIPGPAAVGIIEDIAPDVSGLSIGETVF